MRFTTTGWKGGWHPRIHVPDALSRRGSVDAFLASNVPHAPAAGDGLHPGWMGAGSPGPLSRIHAVVISRGAAESAERRAGHEHFDAGNRAP